MGSKPSRGWRRTGRKLVPVFCIIVVLFALTQLSEDIRKRQAPTFATPQEVAEYAYDGEVQAILEGTDSCLIFHGFKKGTVDFIISSRLGDMYSTENELQSDLITGTSDVLLDVLILKEKNSNDQYIEVVGRGSQNQISVYDSIGTEFVVSFDERVKSDEDVGYFAAIGYLDPGHFSSNKYTVTVSCSDTSESLSLKREDDGSFKRDLPPLDF